MNRNMKNVLILVIILWAALNAQSGQYTWITPDNPAINYTGRIDQSDITSPRLFWPGTAIRATFSGTSLQLALDDRLGESYYNVIIDNDDADPVIIDCQAGLYIYPVRSDMQDTIHSVLVFRRTEASTGVTVFKGFLIDANRNLGNVSGITERKIEFYGNSITCGMGNEAHPDSGDAKMAEENNYLTYAAMTARNLNAEYVCIAKSGIGIMVSWFDLIMPNYYYRLDPADPESKWDFSLYTPDVVVINLLQNDSWLYDKRLDPVPNRQKIIASYMDFIARVRIKYPETQIVCTLGTMDAIAPGKPWPDYVRQAVTEFNKRYGDQKVSDFIFSYQGFNKHPRVAHHRIMAQELTEYLKKLMAW